MEKISSTSSFKVWRRRALHALAFALLIVGVDRLAYLAAFPQFDRVLSLTKLEKPHEILIVGSSHVLWDLDHKWAGQQSGREIEMISVPGANLELRGQLIREYVSRRSAGEAPLWVVMEADKYSFDSKRYPPPLTNSLLGYYHHGILRDLLWERLSPGERALNTLLHVRSLNPSFVFVGSRVHDRAARIFSNLFHPLLRLFEEPTQDATPALPEWMQSGNAPATDTQTETRPGPGETQAGDGTAPAAADPGDAERRRLKKWREQYYQYDVRIDPEPEQSFRELLDFVRNDPRIYLILLDTPNFLLFPEREARFNSEVRARLLAAAEHERIQYWRFDRARFELDASIFADASHLNVPGRIAFTQEFTRRVRELPARAYIPQPVR